MRTIWKGKHYMDQRASDAELHKHSVNLFYGVRLKDAHYSIDE